MVKIEDERDIQDALEQINQYFEKKGSDLHATLVSRSFAKALREYYKREEQQYDTV